MQSRVLLVTGALLVSAALVGGLVERSGVEIGLPGPAPTTPVQVHVPVGAISPVARSRPVHLWVPALGISVAVTTLGLNPDGTVAVPTSTATPGWYRFGSSPGQMGSAVIFGHVDSYLGPGIFYDLRDVRSGDTIVVALADGVHVHFEVTSVAEYLKANFPDARVYGSHGASDLQLVTCGGVFNESTHHYESNVVVYSRLVRSTPLLQS